MERPEFDDTLKLYELKRGELFKIDGAGYPDVYTFDHVDGMYSICWDKDKQIVHLAAWTPVIRVD